jgi:hypothetical protein
MNFSDALDYLKKGFRVENMVWNGKGMYLEIQVLDKNSKMGLPYIYIVMPKDHPTYPGAMVPWTPSQMDLMSNDWEVCDKRMGR